MNRVVVKERRTLVFETASTSGPHITAQCRLPTRPSRNAVQISSMSPADHDRLIEVKFLAVRQPLHAHFPQAGLKLRGVDKLCAVARREFQFAIELRIG